MSASGILAVLEVANAALTIATQLGVNWQRVVQLQQQAELEGRSLGEKELQILANEAGVALDELDDTIKNMP